MKPFSMPPARTVVIYLLIWVGLSLVFNAAFAYFAHGTNMKPPWAGPSAMQSAGDDFSTEGEEVPEGIMAKVLEIPTARWIDAIRSKRHGGDWIYTKHDWGGTVSFIRRDNDVAFPCLRYMVSSAGEVKPDSLLPVQTMYQPGIGASFTIQHTPYGRLIMHIKEDLGRDLIRVTGEWTPDDCDLEYIVSIPSRSDPTYSDEWLTTYRVTGKRSSGYLTSIQAEQDGR